MTTQHTPTPWMVDRDADGLFIRMEALAGQDSYLAIYASPNPEQREADAAFIVQAVNNFALLLEAAKEAHDVIHNLHGQMYHISVGKGICEWGPCKQLRAAIAAAEGREA